MWYNSNCRDEQNTGALCFSEAATVPHNQNIVGKAPSVSRIRPGCSSRQWQQTSGGRFAMVDKNHDVAIWIEESYSGLSVPKIAQKHGISQNVIRYQFGKVGHIVPYEYHRPELSEVEKAWVAAVIDCEGSLSINRPLNKQRNCRNLSYVCRVEMVGDDIPERLYHLCGGAFWTKREKPGNRRPQSLWYVPPAGIRWLLPQILSYLVVKKRQAILILDVLSRRRRGMKQTYLDDKELLGIYHEIRTLNTKGKVPPAEKWSCE